MTPADSLRTSSGALPISLQQPAEPLGFDVLVVRSAALHRPLDYIPVWRAMRSFTEDRQPDTRDELWLLSHRPVFTQGQAGKPEHILNSGDIPVVQIDRGGQVTYHGPGQLVAYLMIDVRRSGTGVRQLVESIEQSVIDVLAEFGIEAQSQRQAPGVYVKDAKIAALGLRIRHGRSYHGLSINVDMDMAPFRRINPCGYEGMAVTQLRDLLSDSGSDLLSETACRLVKALATALGYTRTVNASLDPYQ